jgi:7TM diverse intracellular signalling/7TMR-DISM extracellular 2
MTVEQVAALTHNTAKPFDQHVAHDASWGRPLWLHFRMPARHADDTSQWTLELSKPYIDRVEFYARTPQGGWQVQTAGDYVPHVQWPVQSLNPQFHIPTWDTAGGEFYVRVSDWIPIHFSARVQPTTEAFHAETTYTFLLAGLLLGLMAIMFTLSSAMALIYRNTTYVWYALYTGLTLLTSASYVGMASYAFWPHATRWSNDAVFVFTMLTMGAQTQFCRAMFLPAASAKWVQHGISAVIACTLVSTGLYLLIPTFTSRIGLFTVVAMVCTALMVAIVVHAIRQRSLIAWLWCVAYSPMILVLTLTIVNSFSWLTLPWLHFYAPLYALIFEMPVLLVALHLHAKSQQARHVHRSLRDSFDPHTGFVPSHQHTPTAQALWDTARHNNHYVAVAYAEATSDTPLSQQPMVRLLRTVARDGDTVTHADKNLYAILMPGQHVGTELTNRLSRLVALGHMAVNDLAASSRVQFRIVASSNAIFTGTWLQLDASLRNKLDDSKGWAHKSIRYVSLRTSDDSQRPSDLASQSQLSELWQAASDEAARLDAMKSLAQGSKVL